MKRILLWLPALLCVLSFSVTVNAQQTPDNVQFFNPGGLSTPRGYSHTAIVDLGTCKMVIISGQVPLDKAGNLVGKDDIAIQAGQVFLNIKTILDELRGSMDDIVKLGFYVTDASQLQAIRSARDKYINVNNPPASTLVQVSRLFRPDVMIEVEATAIIPKR
jgi:enamine deaminase RidA (YjgF/YER057c/UK114 family)